MLQQVKQIEEFFRNEVTEDKLSRSSRLSTHSYDFKDYSTDSHSNSKEVEMLKRELADIHKELTGKLCSTKQSYLSTRFYRYMLVDARLSIPCYPRRTWIFYKWLLCCWFVSFTVFIFGISNILLRSTFIKAPANTCSRTVG